MALLKHIYGLNYLHECKQRREGFIASVAKMSEMYMGSVDLGILLSIRSRFMTPSGLHAPLQHVWNLALHIHI